MLDGKCGIRWAGQKTSPAHEAQQQFNAGPAYFRPPNFHDSSGAAFVGPPLKKMHVHGAQQHFNVGPACVRPRSGVALVLLW